MICIESVLHTRQDAETEENGNDIFIKVKLSK